MLSRAAIVILLVIGLCFVGFPSHSKPKPHLAAIEKASSVTTPQDQPLALSTTRVDQPNGGSVWNLTGKYQSAGRIVNLRASSVKPPRIVNLGPPPPNSAEASDPDQRDTDYYYSNSD